MQRANALSAFQTFSFFFYKSFLKWKVDLELPSHSVTPSQTIAIKERNKVDVAVATSKRGQKERLLQTYNRKYQDSRDQEMDEIPIG